jgi:hypothetical protein
MCQSCDAELLETGGNPAVDIILRRSVAFRCRTRGLLAIPPRHVLKLPHLLIGAQNGVHEALVSLIASIPDQHTRSTRMEIMDLAVGTETCAFAQKAAPVSGMSE